MKDRQLPRMDTQMVYFLFNRVRRVIRVAQSVGLPADLAIWRYLEVDWGFTSDEARHFVEGYLYKKFHIVLV